MDESRRNDPVHNAGAFLGPGGTFPAAMHTLSDEIPREPDELEAERRGSARPPQTAHGVRATFWRLLGRSSW
jgi:hypothetical protein